MNEVARTAGRPGLFAQARAELVTRDVLLVRRNVIATLRERSLRVLWLSHTPREGLATFLSWALPEPPRSVDFLPIGPRDDKHEAAQRLLGGDADALVLPRHLIDAALAGGGDALQLARALLSACRVVVLPLSEFASALEQGAPLLECRAGANLNRFAPGHPPSLDCEPLTFGARDGLIVANSPGLPYGSLVDRDAVIWATDLDVWRHLAARGRWVTGSDDSHGDTQAVAIRAWFPHVRRWHVLRCEQSPARTLAGAWTAWRPDRLLQSLLALRPVLQRGAVARHPKG